MLNIARLLISLGINRLHNSVERKKKNKIIGKFTLGALLNVLFTVSKPSSRIILRVLFAGRHQSRAVFFFSLSYWKSNKYHGFTGRKTVNSINQLAQFNKRFTLESAHNYHHKLYIKSPANVWNAFTLSGILHCPGATNYPAKMNTIECTPPP